MPAQIFKVSRTWIINPYLTQLWPRLQSLQVVKKRESEELHLVATKDGLLLPEHQLLLVLLHTTPSLSEELIFPYSRPFLKKCPQSQPSGKFLDNYYLIGGVNNSATFNTHCPKWEMIVLATYPIHFFPKRIWLLRDWAGVGKRK